MSAGADILLVSDAGVSVDPKAVAIALAKAGIAVRAVSCKQLGASWETRWNIDDELEDLKTKLDTELSVGEKIAAIETSGLRVAWDGCHKLYLIEDETDVTTMRGNGYEDDDFHQASEIRRLINESCGLVFVHAASLRNDFPWDIRQGEIFDAFGTDDV